MTAITNTIASPTKSKYSTNLKMKTNHPVLHRLRSAGLLQLRVSSKTSARASIYELQARRRSERALSLADLLAPLSFSVILRKGVASTTKEVNQQGENERQHDQYERNLKSNSPNTVKREA